MTGSAGELMVCTRCGHKNDADAEFCENCGNPLALTCTSCGASIKPGAKFCKRCGTAVRTAQEVDRLASLQLAAPAQLQAKIRAAAPRVEGERKPVTVLFTDIVGSTTHAEKLDPEEWKEVVSGAHQRVSQAIYRYEGTIAQLLGDGVLAFFGAPVTHEDDPLRAVLAAVETQRLIGEYERQLEGLLEHFQMRIGINTGTVVVGSVGSDLHMEYLAIGDAVNLAARLQSAAQPGKVLISESTAKMVQAAFDLAPLGEITVKGKEQPVAVFEVAASKAGLEIQRGFEMLRSPLVGREDELSALRKAFGQLLAGLGQIVAITGEPGIGKSRLVEEARNAFQQDLHWLEGRALSYGQNLSFWTIRQLIQDDLHLSDGDPEIKQRLALRKRVDGLFGAEADQVLPYLGSLMGVQLEGELAERVKILDGETLKHQTLVSISRYVTRFAEQQPLVLVFDDLHWADPSSLEALQRLLPLTDRVPLLLLLVSRLEREHGSWEVMTNAERDYAHRYTEIQLKPLPGEEQNHMMDNLLAITDLPQGVRARILERAEGNPLFLEEIVRHLIDTRAVVQEDGRWRATMEIGDFPIPETLQGVLLARIDRLQEDVRRTLQLAAVIGKSFLYRLLEAIAQAETELESHLAQLQRADLVREKSRLPELEYMFKHSLTQEAAYQSLLVAERRKFHRQVGEALEASFHDRLGEFMGLLAYHFDAAGETDKAIEYLIQAGDKSRLTDELEEAVGYYQRAIELLREIGDEVGSTQVWLKLALVHHANFQFEETYQAYENAFRTTQKPDSPPQPEIISKMKTLRISVRVFTEFIDPGKVDSMPEGLFNSWLFSGLAQVDNELNVIPDIARSWQVLDGGMRYVIHMRDDVRWTDGNLITAHDFEWAWKRNLHPSSKWQAAQFLFDVAGAEAYYQGENHNPDSVGIRTLDDWTLEVRLQKPVAYFPYILTLSNSYPLPRSTIERYGEDWCKPENLVSNGIFSLRQYHPNSSVILERNPLYHGLVPGNVGRVEIRFVSSPVERLQAYLENQIDIIFPVPKMIMPADILPGEVEKIQTLDVWYIFMNPMLAPFTDIRVRRAVQLSLNLNPLLREYNLQQAIGGIIPPGIPGHSPDISPGYYPETARRLLAEAGYPNGKGFPAIKSTVPWDMDAAVTQIVDGIVGQVNHELGTHIEFEAGKRNVNDFPLLFLGWVADYPDPDNFLRSLTHMRILAEMGWQDKEYHSLINSAVSLSDRRQRMQMYRQADRYYVVDQALILPWNYSNANPMLVKPWVKNYHFNLLSKVTIQNVVIEDH